MKTGSTVLSTTCLTTICATRSTTFGTVASNCTLARSAFGIGGDHSPLSSPPRSSFCCAEDQEGLGHRDVEPAPYREGFICSPTRMDRLGTSWHESAYRWPTAIALRCLRRTGA